MLDAVFPLRPISRDSLHDRLAYHKQVGQRRLDQLSLRADMQEMRQVVLVRWGAIKVARGTK